MSDDTTKDPKTPDAAASSAPPDTSAPPTTPAPPDSSPGEDATAAAAEPAEPAKPKGPYDDQIPHWDKTLAGGETRDNALVHIALRALKGQKRSPLHVSVEIMQWLDQHGVAASSLVEPVAEQCEALADQLAERGDEDHAKAIAAVPRLLDRWLRESYGGNMPAKPVRNKRAARSSAEG